MLKYADQLPFKLELITDSVVKKNGRYSLIESIDQTRQIVKHFIRHPDPMVVPVYEWFEGSKDPKGWFTYSYTMKRLCVLSEMERRIIAHCIFLYEKNFSMENTECLLKMGRKVYPTLEPFMEEVISQGRYVDLHNGNFLKDETGAYKIIDVEGFLKFPYDTRDLSWITDED